MTTDVRDWPGAERRHPHRSNPDYLALAPLAQHLSAAVARHCAGRTNLDVLDVGCGDKPYYPYFSSRARTYRGFDVDPGPYVDDTGMAERLPYEDGSFDVVLCTQVLEHADDPLQVVREINRVLRPGGVAFASTHGVFVFHPHPPPDRDYWRWTHAGLARLFDTAGAWQRVAVEPNGEYFTCLGLLLCRVLGWPLGAMPRAARSAVYRVVNSCATWLDRRLPAELRVPNPNSLSSNYLVIAERGSTAPANSRS